MTQQATTERPHAPSWHPDFEVNDGNDATPSTDRHQLQRQARRNIRRHVARSLVRFGVLAVVDAIVLGSATYLATLILEGSHFVPSLSIPGLVGLVVGLLLTGNYGRGDKRLSFGRLFVGLVAGLLIAQGRSYADVSFMDAVTGGIWFAGAFTALAVGRVGIDQVLKRLRPQRAHSARSIVVGPVSLDDPLLESRLFKGGASYRLVGAVVPAGTATHTHLPVLGTYADFARVLEENDVETVFVTGYLPDDLFARIVEITLTAGCEFLSYARTFRLVEVQPELRWCDGEPVIDLTRPGLKGGQLVGKRIVDVFVSVTALIVLAPLLIAVAALVKLTSPGPVFFRQERVGYGGRTFSIYKFRSMDADAEERKADLEFDSIYEDGRLFKIKDDPRVTPFGKFLRRTSLDELPQLFNVLVGDMSLVGPRPPVQQEVALYEDHHYCRFDVKPGITGPWQVGGRNEVTDFEEIVRMEQEYIRNWSPIRDLKILLKTIPVVLTRDGAH